MGLASGSADGSTIGLVIFAKGAVSGSPKRLFVLGNSLYFAADTDDYGIGTLGFWRTLPTK